MSRLVACPVAAADAASTESRVELHRERARAKRAAMLVRAITLAKNERRFWTAKVASMLKVVGGISRHVQAAPCQFDGELIKLNIYDSEGTVNCDVARC